MLQPVADQAGFSEPCRRTDQGQRVLPAIAEPLHKPRAYDQTVRQVRPVQLGLKKNLILVRHKRSISLEIILPLQTGRCINIYAFFSIGSGREMMTSKPGTT